MKIRSRLFRYTDYKLFLRDLVKDPDAERGQQSLMARAMNCQAAYLYQVLNGKAHLTEDQAFKLGKHLELSTLEWEYFFTLWRAARASSPELIEHLKARCEELRQQENNLLSKSDASRVEDSEELWHYYLSSTLPSAVHLLTSCDDFQTVKKLALRLGCSEKTIQSHIDRLHAAKLIDRRASRWVHSGRSIHFPQDSHHNLALQAMRRAQSTSALFERPKHGVHFSSLFTTDKAAVEELKKNIGTFVQKSQRKIHASGSDEMYALCLDFFSP